MHQVLPFCFVWKQACEGVLRILEKSLVELIAAVLERHCQGINAGFDKVLKEMRAVGGFRSLVVSRKFDEGFRVIDVSVTDRNAQSGILSTPAPWPH